MAKNLTPTILFEDTHLVVLSKPAGLLSQGEHTGDDNLVDWLRGHFGRHYVGLVHRLDRNTSGLMVVAKRSKSADRLTQSLQKGDLIRRYQAVVQGRLSLASVWEHWLLKNEKTNTMEVVSKNTFGAKLARLRAEPIRSAQFRGCEITCVDFELETGRSHQIRVQAAAMGHPLIGDPKYGRELAPPLRAFPRPALHSHFISFPHPMSGEILKFEDRLPEEFAGLFA